MNEFDLIYFSMMGEAIHPQPGIVNEYATDSYCDRCYTQLCDARDRLCRKLNTDEDPDLELIFNHFSDITKYLCYKMYEYGRASDHK